jgi:hypothetical protein
MNTKTPSPSGGGVFYCAAVKIPRGECVVATESRQRNLDCNEVIATKSWPPARFLAMMGGSLSQFMTRSFQNPYAVLP